MRCPHACAQTGMPMTASGNGSAGDGQPCVGAPMQDQSDGKFYTILTNGQGAPMTQ